MIVFTALWAVVAALVCTPVLADLWSALRPRRRPSIRGGSSRLTVLVPAHNEEGLLGGCLDALKEAASGLAASVVVIADNCTDGTAAVAAARGVRCMERRDAERRGKPAAIAWALGQGIAAGADAVVVVDADTLVEQSFLEDVASAGPWQGRAGQGRQIAYGSGNSWLLTLSALFMDVRYGIVFPLKKRGGVNCPLTGSGMIVGTDLGFDRMLESAGPAEDLEMYAALTKRGVRVDYLAGARVRLLVESQLGASRTQRRRWAAGRTIAARRYLLSLLTDPKVTIHQKLDSVAELLFPGPVATCLVILPFAIGAWWLDLPGRNWLLVALALPVGRLVVYTLTTCFTSEHPGRAFLALIMIPPYAMWRIGVACSAALLSRSPRWEGTARRP